MLKVLAHRRTVLGKPLLHSLTTRSTLFLCQPYFAVFATIPFLILLSFIGGASGQVVVNGQTFTNGLSIIDAPSAHSNFQAGSTIPIAIDVSGDGKLPQAAATPGSGLATHYDYLEIYLVSSQTNLNLTVSSGTGLLTQESGSTVKHVNFNISTCVPAGQYNLTIYEASHINNIPFFTISPIPIQINNPSPSGSCQSNVNTLQPQPQASSPAPQSPFVPNAQGSQSPLITGSATAPASSGMVTVFRGAGTTGGLTTIPGLITVTVTSSGDLPWPLSLPTATHASGVVTVTVAPTETITATPEPVSVTVVVVSMETVTTTQPGQTNVLTTTVTSASTTTAIMESPDNSGFVPVNAARDPHIAGAVSLMAVATSSLFLLLKLW